MLGFGPKLNTVFQSRRKALLWALSIMATAYCTVPAADQARQQSEDKAAAATPVHHKSPWAKD